MCYLPFSSHFLIRIPQAVRWLIWLTSRRQELAAARSAQPRRFADALRHLIDSGDWGVPAGERRAGNVSYSDENKYLVLHIPTLDFLGPIWPHSICKTGPAPGTFRTNLSFLKKYMILFIQQAVAQWSLNWRLLYPEKHPWCDRLLPFYQGCLPRP